MSDEIANLRKLAIEAARHEAERMRADWAKLQTDIQLQMGYGVGDGLINMAKRLPPTITPGILLPGIAYLVAYVIAQMPACTDPEQILGPFVDIVRNRLARLKGA